MTAPAMLEVAAGLIFRAGRVLLAQRRAGDHLGGLWEFPGGKREAGESFPDALRRELREELGIEVEVGERLATAVHHYPGRSVHLEFYRCHLVSGDPRPTGCAALAWAGREELAHYTFPAADEGMVAQLRERPEFWQWARAPAGPEKVVA
jgi:mutator protein MutT